MKNLDSNIVRQGFGTALVGVVACLTMSGKAQATVIMDFESIAGHATEIIVGPTFTEAGFTLTKTTGLDFRSPGTTSHNFTGSTSLIDPTVNGVTTLTANNGNPFNFVSIDLGELNLNAPTDVPFTGTLAGGGTVTQTVTLDGVGFPSGVETFSFGSAFENVQSVSWVQVSPHHQMDNLVLDQSAAPPPSPPPSTLTTTMDFETIAPHTEEIIVGPSFSESGFTVTKTTGLDFRSPGTNSFNHTGSTSLIDPTVNGVTTLTADNGKSFDLVSIDLGELNLNAPTDVPFTGNLAGGGTVSQTITLDGTGFPTGVETFTFDSSFKDLESVSWVQVSPHHQFDNLTLKQATTDLGAVLISVGNVETIGANSTLENTGNYTIEGTLTNNGDFVNKGGLVTIESGGLMDGAGSFTQESGSLIVNGDINIGKTVSILDGTLSGAGTINGNVFLGDEAEFAPGNSPGTLIINGDLTVEDGAVIQIEFGDEIQVKGNLEIQPGAIIEIIFGDLDLPPVSVDLADFFVVDNTVNIDTDIVRVFSDTPGATIDVIASNDLDFVPIVDADVGDKTNASTVNVLTDVPEPGTLAIFGIGLAGLGLMRRRRKTA